MGRPITVQVGPLASATATKISTSQKSAGSPIVLNGAAGTATANNIATSQTPSGAGNLTLDGSTVTSGVANLGSMVYVYITSAGNDSGRTFTVSGYGYNASGGPYAISETITGANASTVSSTKKFQTITSIAISGAAAGAVTVGTYGAATLDTARRVLITSAGNDSGITFAITGTNWAGDTISETLTGPNATTAYTVLDYLTVTSIVPSGAVASTLTIGTNTIASSPWVYFDQFASMGPVSIQVDGTGTVNWTIQQTLNDPNALQNNPVAVASMDWLSHPDTTLVGSTTTTGVQGNYAYPPAYARVLLNSGTGTVKATFVQNYLK